MPRPGQIPYILKEKIFGLFCINNLKNIKKKRSARFIFSALLSS